MGAAQTAVLAAIGVGILYAAGAESFATKITVGTSLMAAALYILLNRR